MAFPYFPPLVDIKFVLTELVGLDKIAAFPAFQSDLPGLAASVLEEAGHIAEGVLSPLNRQGDEEGAKIVDGTVRTPKGWREAWAILVEGGWNGLPFSTEWGGMGLPNILNTAVHEMWQSANMAFTLCPMLTQGAVNAIRLYGSGDLRRRYLPKLVSGIWTGTMNLTEPQAGSDLAAVRTKAVPDGDHYKISGQKIFITYGDHDMAANIVHLVLARVPDAPLGVKGLSLFVVPKILTDHGGAPLGPNDVHCMSLEHKLGIHGSPTAIMSFGDHGGAVGYLVGELHHGLEYMFAMMNHARLAVGLQGLAIAERAYQQAIAYARSRVQGRPAGWSGADTPNILFHPDVRRMAMTMKCQIEAMRAIHYLAASAVDGAHHDPDPDERRKAQILVDILTPIAKGWCTEVGQTLASVGLQIHGGMGYIEETGAAQHFRDARITTIYEGTTAIQANDFVNRKVARDKGAMVLEFLNQIEAQANALVDNRSAQVAKIGRALALASPKARMVVGWLAKSTPEEAAASAVPALEMMGILVGGHLLGQSAAIASNHVERGEDADGFYRAKIGTAGFYMAHILPHLHALASVVSSGADAVMAVDERHL